MMAQNLNLLLAFLAGLLSFLSPCVLPLIPSYLSLIGGAAFDEQRRDGRSGRWPVFLRTMLFVAGFSVVFIVLGILFSGAGGFLTGASRVVNLVAGGLVVLLGLNFIFNFWKFLNFEKKVHMSSAPRGLLGSLALGMAFGAGWTPCVGPILASILFLAGSGGQVLLGSALLAVYSLGLGLPFLLAGLFFSQFMRQRDRFKAHFRALRIASGSFLVFIGLLILSGRLQRLNITLYRLAAGLASWQQAHPEQVRLLFAGLLAVPGLLFLAFFLAELFRPAGLQPAGPARRRRIMLRPSLALLFLALAGLTFAGTLNPAGFLSFWLAYQGI
jgi:cytochrome c-type biogenesis protein